MKGRSLDAESWKHRNDRQMQSYLALPSVVTGSITGPTSAINRQEC